MSISLAGCSGYTTANTQSTAPKTLSASRASIDFGSVAIGGSSTQSVTITNSGTASITVSQTQISGASFALTGAPTLSSITGGQSVTLQVRFAPASSGSTTGSLSLTSDASNSPTTVALSGAGVPATTLLGATPSSLNFGNVYAGSSSSQNVIVTNTGNSNVTISGVSTSGTGFGASGLSANTILTPGQSATLTVSFAPTSASSVSGSVSVASNATNSPAVATLSGAGVSFTSGLPTCGKLNDTNVYLPPNYDTFTPPAKGQSYTDPVFGCKITRITDAVAMGWQQGKHWYNTITPFNANDTYIMLTPSGSPTIVDALGNTVVSQANFPAMNYTFAVWDTTNPAVFYYTSGNQFFKGTITGTPPNATVTPTVLATFSQYGSVTIPDDEDLSNDGVHIWLSSGGGSDSSGNIFLATLNAGNGAATGATASTTLTNITYHKLQIVANNGVSVESASRTIYSPNGTSFTPGGGGGNHTDWGLDDSSLMVAASLWYAGTAQNGCPSNWGIGLLDLTTNAVRLCLNDGMQNVANAWHISARDVQSQHWIIWSADDSNTCPSSSYYCFNNPTNTSGWSLYTGEIDLFTSSGTIVRLAHHRSRTDENYWAQTRAVLSRDGRYALYDSNYNQSSTSSGANYTDVFVIGPLY